MATSRKDFPIAVDKRVPWGGVSGEADIPVIGVDWSGGTFAMQIRNEPGDSGAALVSLTNASAGAEGFSASFVTDYTDPVSGEEAEATIIRPQINETTLEGLAYGADPSDPVKLFYDIHATVSGLGKFVLMAGTFTIKPGVTL